MASKMSAIALEQVDVDRLDVPAADQPQAGVARRRDHVELLGTRREQRERLIRRPEDLRIDLASAGVLEVRDPVDGLVGRTVLDVARPGQDVDALALGAPEIGGRGQAGPAAALADALGEPPGTRARPGGARRGGGRTTAAAARREDQRGGPGQGQEPPSQHAVPPPPLAVLPSATGSSCCRFQIRRTALPCCSSTSVEVVVRFCSVTTSRAPASRSTM